MKVRPSLDWLLALVPVAIGMRLFARDRERGVLEGRAGDFIMAISFFFVEHL